MRERSPEGPTPGRRARWGALGALVVVLGASLLGSVHPWYDPTNDGSMYIATARSLVAGEGYRYLGIPFLIRPPGFSCLIAPVLGLFGTDFLALNLWVSVWGALGVLAFHFVLRARLGLLLATLVPLVLWFNPGYQRLCNQVMSDVPGWTLLVVCLGLAAHPRLRGGVRWSLLIGAAIGLASYVRSGNLLLVPAILCSEALRECFERNGRLGWRTRARHAAALVLGALLVLVPWSIRNRLEAPPAPADQTLLYSYSSGMWHTDMGDPRSPRLPLSAILERAPEQTAKTMRTLGTRLQEGREGAWDAVLTPTIAWLLLIALVFAAARRRAPEEFFALGTLLVVAFYFGYAGRLLLPVFALALAALVELLRAALAHWLGARVATAGAALFCLAWIGLDWNPRAQWDEIRSLHQAYVESARQVSRQLPPGARLGAYRGWHHAVYLEREVFSFEQACERAGSPAAGEEIIDKYGLDWVLSTPLGLPQPVAREERAFAAFVARRYVGNELGLVRVR